MGGNWGAPQFFSLICRRFQIVLLNSKRVMADARRPRRSPTVYRTSVKIRTDRNIPPPPPGHSKYKRTTNTHLLRIPCAIIPLQYGKQFQYIFVKLCVFFFFIIYELWFRITSVYSYNDTMQKYNLDRGTFLPRFTLHTRTLYNNLYQVCTHCEFLLNTKFRFFFRCDRSDCYELNLSRAA